MKKHTILLISLAIFISLASCARERSIPLPKTSTGKPPDSYVVNGKRYYRLPGSHGFVQTGKASWYGSKFHGRPTASGEIYDMYKKSAAHKTLPLGTYVRVINLSNKKETIVRINDRGPFVKGRVIDLSYAAAKEIDLVGVGVLDVKVIALAKEVDGSKSKKEGNPRIEMKDLEKGEFTIQVGAFMDKNNAQTLADRLRVLYGYVNITRYVDRLKGTLYRVHVSKSNTLHKAMEIEKKLEDMGFAEAFIVRL